MEKEILKIQKLSRLTKFAISQPMFKKFFSSFLLMFWLENYCLNRPREVLGKITILSSLLLLYHGKLFGNKHFIFENNMKSKVGNIIRFPRIIYLILNAFTQSIKLSNLLQCLSSSCISVWAVFSLKAGWWLTILGRMSPLLYLSMVSSLDGSRN